MRSPCGQGRPRPRLRPAIRWRRTLPSGAPWQGASWTTIEWLGAPNLIHQPSTLRFSRFSWTARSDLGRLRGGRGASLQTASPTPLLATLSPPVRATTPAEPAPTPGEHPVYRRFMVHRATGVIHRVDLRTSQAVVNGLRHSGWPSFTGRPPGCAAAASSQRHRRQIRARNLPEALYEALRRPATSAFAVGLLAVAPRH